MQEISLVPTFVINFFCWFQDKKFVSTMLFNVENILYHTLNRIVNWRRHKSGQLSFLEVKIFIKLILLLIYRYKVIQMLNTHTGICLSRKFAYRFPTLRLMAR